MNILHTAKTFVAGVPIRLTNFLNKYSKEVNARCLIKRPKDLYFPDNSNIIWDNGNVEILKSLIKWADIIHIHNSPPFRNNDEWGLIRDKTVILHLHSEPQSCYGFFENMNANGIKLSANLCIAQYQAIYVELPKTIVRNVVDINDPLLQPVYEQYEKPLITYSPTNTLDIERVKKRGQGEWAYKSYTEVMKVFNFFGDKHKTIDYRVITGTPYEEHLKLKQKANIHIDEFNSGSYHLSSLEGLSQGSIVIANIASWMKEFLVEFLHCVTLPWFTTNSKDFMQDFSNLLGQRDLFLEAQKQSREWMEEFWNPELVLNDYMGVYKKL